MQTRYILQASNDIDSDSLINWFIAFSVCSVWGLISNSCYTCLFKRFSVHIADGKSEKDDYTVSVVKGREAHSFSSVWWQELIIRPGENELFSCISFLLCSFLQCHCPFSLLLHLNGGLQFSALTSASHIPVLSLCSFLLCSSFFMLMYKNYKFKPPAFFAWIKKEPLRLHLSFCFQLNPRFIEQGAKGMKSGAFHA